MPSPPNWSFVLCDLQGTVLGEVTGAKDRTLTLPLNRIPTATFTIPLWHQRAADVLTGDCLLKVYRRDYLGINKLLFVGIVLSCEENGSAEGQSIAVTATGPFWRLTKRVIGTSKAGVKYGSEDSLRDYGLIAHDILDTVNGQEFTGINKGTTSPSASGVYGPLWLKNAAEGIAELASGINSFDYEVQPVEPTNVGEAWPRIGLLNCLNIIGTNKPDAVFEYGTTRSNVVSYNRTKSNDSLLTRAWISLPGWPDGVTAAQDLLTRTNTGGRAARGLYEEVVNDAGVIDDGMRGEIAQTHVDIRYRPREIVTFSPSPNVRPAPFTDYSVGDFVRARAVVRDSLRFDAMFRIWGITFKIDQNGNESLDLQLVQE